mgnify:FL=1
MEKGVDFNMIMRHKTHNMKGLKASRVWVPEDRELEMKELFEHSLEKSLEKHKKKYSKLGYFDKQDVIQNAIDSQDKKLWVIRDSGAIADKATGVVNSGLQVMKMFLNSTLNFAHNSQLSGFDGYFEMNNADVVEGIASDSDNNQILGNFIAKICENRALKALGREQGKIEAIHANELKNKNDVPFDMGELRGIGFDDEDVMQ